MGIEAGTKHNVGTSHRSVQGWVRSAKAGDELRAGKGLYLRHTDGGDFWVYRYRSPVTGKQVRAQLWANDEHGVLGFPLASLEEATLRAARLRAAVADGVDPVLKAVDDRQARNQATESARLNQHLADRAAAEAAEAAALAAQRRVTVRRLFEQWQRAELTPHRLADGTRTGRKDGGLWVRDSFERRLFPALGAVAAEDVRRADLLQILDDCKAQGRRRTANVLLADIRQMFRFACEREIVQRNPLDGIKRASIGGKDVERDRVLSDQELKLLWMAVPNANMGPRSVAAVWVLVATACRVGEAMNARWEHVDLERKTWYLPETKNERDHTIHLSALAITQFEALVELRQVLVGDDGRKFPAPWVFPNSAGTGPVDVKSFGKQLADRQRTPDQRLTNRTKHTQALQMPGGHWTAHDLRRTAATLMASSGVSTDVIDECLNHKLQSRVARVYIKDRRLADQARAFDALSCRLTAIFTDSAPSVGG